MSFTIRVTDTADEAIRDVILGSIVTDNNAKTGINDYRPLVVVPSDDAESVIGGLWGGRRSTGCSPSCSSSRNR